MQQSAIFSNPSPFVAYNGVSVISWPAAPILYSTVGNCSGIAAGLCNSNAVFYDTNFLGAADFYGNPYLTSSYLSPITRVTDGVSVPGFTDDTCTAGQGGSGDEVLTSTNTGLVYVGCASQNQIALFNTTTGLATGYLTTNECVTTSFFTCPSVGGNPADDVGGGVFSQTDSLTGSTFNFYSFGNNTHDIQGSSYDGMTIVDYQITPATPAYSIASGIVDWKWALPQQSASAWATSTSYSYGAYVTHTLTTAEMLNGGVWTTGLTVIPGDIISGTAGSGCMYRAIVGGTTAGTEPSFLNSSCNNATLTESGGVKWRGTNSTPQFLYQDITSGTHTSKSSTFQWIITPNTSLATNCAMSSTSSAVLTCSSAPFLASQVGQAICVSNAGSGSGQLCSTIAVYTSTTQVSLATAALHTTSTATVSFPGHPDLLSSTVGDANGLIWQNHGPAYTPSSSAQVWTAIGGISKDVLGPNSNPEYYGISISTNTYGNGYPSGGYNKYNADQGSGGFFIIADFSGAHPVFHLLDSFSGIWTDFTCGSGTAYATCGSETATVIGSLTAITAPSGITPPTGITTQSCPFYSHNLKMSYVGPNSLGLWGIITNQANIYPACDNPGHYQLWTLSGSFNSATSLQFTNAGLNHWAVGQNQLFAFTQNGLPTGGFTSLYTLPNGVTGAPNFSVYLAPGQTGPLTYPLGCYTSGTQSPQCALGSVLDGHPSLAAGDTAPAGTALYNYATLGPAFNAWQNKVALLPTQPQYLNAATPPNSVGPIWQLSDTFNTGTNLNFDTQFTISEYSQDGNWIFWTSDDGCTLGSTTGSAPTVYSGSGTYVGYLAVPYSNVGTQMPATVTALCGNPWIASTTYYVGNLINPITSTTGAGGVQDVYQAIMVTGNSGAGSGTPLNPICGATPCWTQTNAPTATTGGDYVCDSTSGGGTNVVSTWPTLPTCAAGVTWEDMGPQTGRGDVFAVQTHPPFHAGIPQYIGSAQSTQGTPAGNCENFTCTVGYTAQPGNQLVVFYTIAEGGTTPDTCGTAHTNPNGTAPLTAGPSATNGTSTTYSYTGTAPTNMSAVSCVYTAGSAANSVIHVYECASCTLNTSLSGNTNTGSISPVSVTPTTTANNGYIVGALNAVAQAITVTTGTQLQHSTSSPKTALVSNFGATAGSLSVSGTIGSGTAWSGVAIGVQPGFPAASLPILYPTVGGNGIGFYASAQPITITSSPGAIACELTSTSVSVTPPSTNGNQGCANGTLVTGPVTVSTGEDLFATGGGYGLSDSNPVYNLYSIGGICQSGNTGFQASFVGAAEPWPYHTSGGNASILNNTLGYIPEVYAALPGQPTILTGNSSFCGPTWQASYSYASGNIIEPIPGGQTWQAITTGTSGGTQPSLFSGTVGTTIFNASPIAVFLSTCSYSSPYATCNIVSAGTGSPSPLNPDLAYTGAVVGSTIVITNYTPNTAYNGSWVVTSSVATPSGCITTCTTSSVSFNPGSNIGSGSCGVQSGSSITCVIYQQGTKVTDGGVTWQNVGPQNQYVAASPSCTLTGASLACTNSNSGVTLMCYAIAPTVPASNGGLATSCATGTEYTGAVTLSHGQTANVIAGVQGEVDSFVASYTYP